MEIMYTRTVGAVIRSLSVNGDGSLMLVGLQSGRLVMLTTAARLAAAHAPATEPEEAAEEEKESSPDDPAAAAAEHSDEDKGDKDASADADEGTPRRVHHEPY